MATNTVKQGATSARQRKSTALQAVPAVPRNESGQQAVLEGEIFALAGRLRTVEYLPEDGHRALIALSGYGPDEEQFIGLYKLDASDAKQLQGHAGDLLTVTVSAHALLGEDRVAVPAPAPTVTRDTFLQDGGEIALDIVRRCTYEIEALSMQIITEADSCCTRSDTGAADRVLRGTAARIHQLNSLIMSYLSGDDSVTLFDAAMQLDRTSSRLNAELDRQGSQQ